MYSRHELSTSDAPEGRKSVCARLLVIQVALILCQGGTAQGGQRGAQPVNGEAVRVTVPMVSEPWSQTLSAPAPAAQKQVQFIGHYPGFQAAKKKANQILLQHLVSERTSAKRTAPTPAPEATTSTSAVFPGPSESDTEFIPPDPQVAAGPTQVVVAINRLLAVYDKTGAQQGSFQQLPTFFGSLGITGQIYDPRVIYDQTDGRFVLTAADVDFTNFTSGVVLVAVSQTSDATGVWNKYAVTFKGRNLSNSANTFPDYPTLGLSPSAIYISTGQFELNSECRQSDSCSFSDTWIKVIGLPALLSGSPTLTVTTFQNVQTATGSAAFAIEPAVSYGTPPVEFLAAADFSANPNSVLNLFSITTSGTPTLQTTQLAVPAFSLPPDAVQPDSGALIMTDDFRLLNAVWSGGSLWCGQNTADATRFNPVAAWYEIQLTGLSSATLSQSGIVSGVGAAYYPALSVTNTGVAGMFFTTSSESLFASAAFTAREATDPPGTMRSYGVLRSGSGPYNELPVPNRWGDFSGISLDPDGQTLWGIAELAGTPNPHFETAIAQIAGPPELSASPGALNFGSVSVGQSASPQSVMLTNISSGSVPIGQLRAAGTNAADFPISNDGCSGVTLAANQTCTFMVGFNPSSAAYQAQLGQENAFLTIPYSGSGVMLTVGLVGVGVEAPVFTFTPSSVTFPQTVLQHTSSQLVTVTNTGNTAGGFYDLNVFSPFQVSTNCPAELAPGGTCTINVTFSPITAGSFSDDILCSGWTGCNVHVSGVGVTSPSADLCPLSLNFGNQVTGTSSSPEVVSLTNNGSSQLTITGVTASGDFAQTNTCLGGIAPRGVCQISVTFAPTTSGARTGIIQISDDATGSPQTVSLSGTGVTSAAALIEAVRGKELASRTEWASRFPASSQAERRPNPRQLYLSQPLFFEPNVGQFASGVEFGARLPGVSLAITNAGLALVPGPRNDRHHATIQERHREGSNLELPTPRMIGMVLVGANPRTRAHGLRALDGKTNYFIGRDPSLWRTDVPTYAKVRLRKIYPGIDLDYYGNQYELEYDFVIAPGANPNAIQLRFAEVGQAHGDLHTMISRNGDLLVESRSRTFRFHKPAVYQMIPDRRGGKNVRRFLEGHYILLASNEVGFSVAAYDLHKPLVIDPVLSFSTYLAGSSQDAASAIAVDSAGNAYVTGETQSADFPTSGGAFQTSCSDCGTNASTNAFVTKLGPDGSLIYSTYLGGQSEDEGFGIAVDSSGAAYVTGFTGSGDFPVTSGAFQSTCPNTTPGYCSSGFVTKLSPTGSALIYSTYLGGTAAEGGLHQGQAIAVDSAGNAVVGGATAAQDFPTTSGALRTTGPYINGTSGQPAIGFVSKLDATGSNLLYSTYLGGSGNDSVNAVAVDSSGNFYAAGSATSLNFPTTPTSFQPGSYGADAFITKFSPSGSLVYSTLLGGMGIDAANAIAVGPDESVYVAGTSNSGPTFPLTPGAFSGGDLNNFPEMVFVGKLHSEGCALEFAADPVVGTNGIRGNSISLDSAGDVYVAGIITVGSGVSLTLKNSLQPPLFTFPAGNTNAFISEVDPRGSKLLFSTYLGGSQANFGNALAVDSNGNIFVAGSTTSADFPVSNPAQLTCPDCTPTYSRGGAFVSKINPVASGGVLLTRPSLNFANAPINATQPEVQVIGLMNQRSSTLNISSISVSGDSFSSVTSVLPCSGSLGPGTGCSIPIRFLPTAEGLQTGTITIADDAPGSPRTVALQGQGLADFGFGSSPQTIQMIGRQDSFTDVVYCGPTQWAPWPMSGNVMLTCNGISPAVCSFNPPTLPAGSVGSSTLTVTNFNALTGNVINFSVEGTLGSQTAELPFIVTIYDFSLSAAPASATIAAGQSATFTLTVTPQEGFNFPLNFSCTTSAPQSSCSTSPANPVVPNPTQYPSITITVTTAARSGAPGVYRLEPPRGFRPVGRGWPLGLLAWTAFLLTLLMWRARGRRSYLTLAAGLIVLALWVSCGGGGGGSSGGSGGGGGGGGTNGTTAGTYTVTITGSINGVTPLSHSTTVTLTVQ